MAGYALAHVTGSGTEASEIITALSRVLKKVVGIIESWWQNIRPVPNLLLLISPF